jgi:hypothetical protein
MGGATTPIPDARCPQKCRVARAPGTLPNLWHEGCYCVHQQRCIGSSGGGPSNTVHTTTNVDVDIDGMGDDRDE